MRSENEIRKKIEEIWTKRRLYLKERHAGEYSMKLYHYARALRWVIEELEFEDLGVSYGETPNSQEQRGSKQ